MVVCCITHLGFLGKPPPQLEVYSKATHETSLCATLKLMKDEAVSELLEHYESSVNSHFLPMGLAHSVQPMMATLIIIII